MAFCDGCTPEARQVWNSDGYKLTPYLVQCLAACGIICTGPRDQICGLPEETLEHALIGGFDDDAAFHGVLRGQIDPQTVFDPPKA